MKFKKIICVYFVCVSGILYASQYYQTISEVQDYYKKQYSSESIAYSEALKDIQKIVSSDMTQEEKCKKLKQLLPSNRVFFVKNDFSWGLKNISIAYKVGAEWTECFSYTQNASISKSALLKIASAKTDIGKQSSSNLISSTSDKNNNESKAYSIGGSAKMRGILPSLSANVSGSYGKNFVQSDSDRENSSFSNDFSSTGIRSIELSASQKAGLDNLAQKVSSNSVKLSDIFLQLDVEFYNGTDDDLIIPPQVGLEFGSGFMFLETQSSTYLPKGRTTVVIYKTPLSDTAKLGIIDFIRNEGKPYLNLEKSGAVVKSKAGEDLIRKHIEADELSVSLSSNAESSKFSINSNYHGNGKVSLGDIIENLNKTVYGREIVFIRDGNLIINGVSSKPEKNSKWIVSIRLNDKIIPNAKISGEMELKKGDSLMISVDDIIYCSLNETYPPREVIEQYTDLKNPMAEFLMGETYCDIDFEDGGVGGTDENCAEAFKWYMKSAKQGNSFGQAAVSGLFLLGKGVEADLDKAKFWGKKSAEQGNVIGQLFLGILYFCEENYTDGLKWFLEAERQCRKDSIFADMVPALQCSLGELYYSGEGIEQNYKEAFKWYKKAAEQGDADAQYALGCLYGGGQGVEKNMQEAIKWLKMAAEQGNADAQYLLGLLYCSDEGIEQDYEEAFKWCKKAAEQGNAGAQCKLGNLYFSGEGVEKNSREAFKWIEKAAEQGDADAQCALGNLYYIGEGVEKNSREAFKWIEKAAEQGNADGQCALGNLYYMGEGVERNPREALKWYKKAAEQGHEIAQKRVKDLKFF